MNQAQQFATIFQKASEDRRYQDDLTAFLSRHTIVVEHSQSDGGQYATTDVIFHDQSRGAMVVDHWNERMTYHPSNNPVNIADDSMRSEEFIKEMRDLQRQGLRAAQERATQAAVH